MITYENTQVNLLESLCEKQKSNSTEQQPVLIKNPCPPFLQDFIYSILFKFPDEPAVTDSFHYATVIHS